MTETPNGGGVRVAVDFHPVAPERLRDTELIAGAMIAAAGACGLGGLGVPIVRATPDGRTAAVLLTSEAHFVAHALPERSLLLLDLLLPGSHDFRKVVDVFARRLAASAVHTDVHAIHDHRPAHQDRRRQGSDPGI